MALDFSNYISVSQFAELCGCTRKTIYRWMEAGLTPWYSTAPDRAHYFEKDKSIAYANQRRERHASQADADQTDDPEPSEAEQAAHGSRGSNLFGT